MKDEGGRMKQVLVLFFILHPLLMACILLSGFSAHTVESLLERE